MVDNVIGKEEILSTEVCERDTRNFHLIERNYLMQQTNFARLELVSANSHVNTKGGLYRMLRMEKGEERWQV